jgi:hypothetical protein
MLIVLVVLLMLVQLLVLLVVYVCALAPEKSSSETFILSSAHVSRHRSTL